jgi:branched-chain amino acid aminotransferase
MKQQWIFMNKEFVLKEDAKVSVYDHGFLYGDGVFEGIRAYNGNVFKLREHMLRLYESAKSILLTF